jgi:CMP-N-acetylneuraminic acid synthetase
MLKTICFVPIKKNSERIVNKNFKKIYKKKLYKILIDKLKKLSCFDEIIIDTDSKEILDYCSRNKVKTIKRLKKLTSKNTNGNDLSRYWYKKFPFYDLYFTIHVTCPFLKPKTIINACNFLKKNKNYNSILLGEFMYDWFWYKGKPINHSVKLPIRTQELIPVIKDSTALYGIKVSQFKKGNWRVGDKPFFQKIDAIEAIDIDNHIDLKIARKLA